MPPAMAGERVDRVVASEVDRSRREVRDLVEGGDVAVNGARPVSPSLRVAAGDIVEVDVPPRAATEPEPDPGVEVVVVHADDDVIVVDKPPGLVVHPGHGRPDATLVNGLLARFPELAGVGEAHRPGIVHRLDVGTSGLLIVARTPDAHAALVTALAERAVRRRYDTVVAGRPEAAAGLVDAPVGRDPREPSLMAVVADGRPARTRYEVVEGFEAAGSALLACELETGRTHQIRVHLSAIGHPVVGDVRYGGPARAGVHRPLLHARELTFPHPRTGVVRSFESPWPPDLTAAVEAERAA